jgi:hypothetical protein
VAADAEHHHVDVPEVRPAALQRGQVGLSAAGDQGQVLAGRGAHIGRIARVPEVGMPVHEDEADVRADLFAEPVHGQRRADQHRAVAAQDEREVARVLDRADPVGQPHRVSGDQVRVTDPVARLPVARVVPGRGQAAGVAGGEPADQSVVAQRARRLGAAGHRGRGGRAEAEVRRRVEDRDPPCRRTGPDRSAHDGSVLEECAGQRPPRRGDRRVVRAGDGE